MFLLFQISCNDPTESDYPVKCTKCKCFEVSCDAIDNPDIDCQNTFVDSCSSSFEIVPLNSCNMLCECCYKGACLQMFDYECILIKGYHVFLVMGLVNIAFQLLYIVSLFNYYFKLIDREYPWPSPESIYVKTWIPKQHNPYFFYYFQYLWIDWDIQFNEKILEIDENYDNVKELKKKVDQFKPLAVFNFIVIFLSFILFIIYLLFMLTLLINQNPSATQAVGLLIYQGSLFGTFWLSMMIVRLVITSYSVTLNKLFEEFSNKHKAKVYVDQYKGSIEIDFKPIVPNIHTLPEDIEIKDTVKKELYMNEVVKEEAETNNDDNILEYKAVPVKRKNIGVSEIKNFINNYTSNARSSEIVRFD